MNRKCLKSIFSVKIKTFQAFFWIYIPILVISFLLLDDLICKVWADLINEREIKTQGFLGKISESHEKNLSRGHWVVPENYSYLKSTKLLDPCCYFVQLILLDCGSIVIVYHRINSWVITEFYKKKKSIIVDFRLGSSYASVICRNLLPHQLYLPSNNELITCSSHSVF